MNIYVLGLSKHWKNPTTLIKMSFPKSQTWEYKTNLMKVYRSILKGAKLELLGKFTVDCVPLAHYSSHLYCQWSNTGVKQVCLRRKSGPLSFAYQTSSMNVWCYMNNGAVLVHAKLLLNARKKST